MRTQRPKSPTIGDDVVLPLPSAEELQTLRKGLRRLKAPTMVPDTDYSNPEVGCFNTIADGDEVRINWQIVDGDTKSALFSELCGNLGYADLRLEYGWMMANSWRVEGLRLLWSIPGPNEAMQKSDRFFMEEDRWRAWALGK